MNLLKEFIHAKKNDGILIYDYKNKMFVSVCYPVKEFGKHIRIVKSFKKIVYL